MTLPNKLKVLFDTQQLASFGVKKGTGIFRVTDEIFKRLAARNDIELFCYLDKNHENVIEYLKINYPAYQNHLVFLPNLAKTARDRNFFIKSKSLFYKLILAKKYSKIIKKFDWYFSPYNPISSIVSDNIKTAIFIHDLIPITHPKYVAPKFRISYQKFIDNLKVNFAFFASNSSRTDFLNYRKDFLIKNTAITPLAADQKFQPITDQNTLEAVKTKYKITATKYFLSASDFSPRKNILFTVKNFLNFITKNKIQDTQLVLAGPNQEFGFNSIKNFEGFKENSDKIIFTGFIDDHDLPALYSGALAFIYVPIYEGFGLPPLEAMQCGTVSIASNTSSIPEVVGDAAILINPKNNQELIESLEQIYNNPQLKQQLAIKCLDRSKDFSWDQTVEKIVQTWQNY